jgi:hypothetical protein
MKNGKVSFEKVKYEFNFDFEKAKNNYQPRVRGL